MPGAAGTPPAAPPAAAAVTCTLKSGKILIIPAAQHPASVGEEVQQQRLSLRRLQQQSQAHCNPIKGSHQIASLLGVPLKPRTWSPELLTAGAKKRGACGELGLFASPSDCKCSLVEKLLNLKMIVVTQSFK
ncbi:hypothetical protein DUI87_23170 [Hirundo rustica rustica]|uniref:Uncharacterized protein n=1 Tax=Hirundo rustica rustica TaxID=333673 RepID=A0A3M0JND0_HIRRU|nr:hypothetical protein DUI87_23170 [Hirundo rustica rustica]